MEGESSQSTEIKDEIVQLYSHLNHLYDSHASLQTQVNYLTQRVLMLEAAASPSVGAAPRIVAVTSPQSPPKERHDLRPLAAEGKATARTLKRRMEKAEKKSEAYTPLAFPIEDIFEFIKEDKLLRWPEKLRAPPHKRNKATWCRFHQDHGHETEQCYALKDEIERLIGQGMLRRFLKDV